MSSTMQAVNLSEKLAQFQETWQPKTVTQFNGHDVMVVKVLGEFNWHSHADTDDFFMVLSGELILQTKAQDIRIGPGELYVVPKGVEHCPLAEQETHLLLIEPTGTPNTGNVETAAVRETI